MRGIKRFNMKGKLAPRYVGPFNVLEEKEKLPIVSSYLPVSLGYMISFMCLN